MGNPAKKACAGAHAPTLPRHGVGQRKLFLFDYDGVIADSFDSLLGVCVEAQVALGKGRTPTCEDFQRIRNLTFEDLGRLIGLPESLCGRYARKVFELQHKGWQPRAFPDVVRVIGILAQKHTVGVVTNSLSDTVSAALHAFGIGSAVSAVKGGDSGLSKSDRIRHLQQAYDVPAGATFMIGDTLGDLVAGREAGVKTVAVTWGFQERGLLISESPDVVVDRAEELLSIVEE